MFLRWVSAKTCYGFEHRCFRAASMSRRTRDRSIAERRFPEGTGAVLLLAAILLGGVYLIVTGLL